MGGGTGKATLLGNITCYVKHANMLKAENLACFPANYLVLKCEIPTQVYRLLHSASLGLQSKAMADIQSLGIVSIGQMTDVKRTGSTPILQATVSVINPRLTHCV